MVIEIYSDFTEGTNSGENLELSYFEIAFLSMTSSLLFGDKLFYLPFLGKLSPMAFSYYKRAT